MILGKEINTPWHPHYILATTFRQSIMTPAIVVVARQMLSMKTQTCSAQRTGSCGGHHQLITMFMIIFIMFTTMFLFIMVKKLAMMKVVPMKIG